MIAIISAEFESNIELSVVIPMFNESENIDSTVNQIIKTFKDKENWFETTEEEMVAKTKSIYTNPIQLIKEGETIQSAWAIWKLQK
mgnify:CR=1 FL=1